MLLREKKGAVPKADPHFSTATASPTTSRTNPAQARSGASQSDSCEPLDLLASKISDARKGASLTFLANRQI
jgi:hypothetical protein